MIPDTILIIRVESEADVKRITQAIRGEEQREVFSGSVESQVISLAGFRASYDKRRSLILNEMVEMDVARAVVKALIAEDTGS